MSARNDPKAPHNQPFIPVAKTYSEKRRTNIPVVTNRKGKK